MYGAVGVLGIGSGQCVELDLESPEVTHEAPKSTQHDAHRAPRRSQDNLRMSVFMRVGGSSRRSRISPRKLQERTRPKHTSEEYITLRRDKKGNKTDNKRSK